MSRLVYWWRVAFQKEAQVHTLERFNKRMLISSDGNGMRRTNNKWTLRRNVLICCHSAGFLHSPARLFQGRGKKKAKVICSRNMLGKPANGYVWNCTNPEMKISSLLLLFGQSNCQHFSSRQIAGKQGGEAQTGPSSGISFYFPRGMRKEGIRPGGKNTGAVPYIGSIFCFSVLFLLLAPKRPFRVRGIINRMK